MEQVDERFWSKVKKTESCWIWQGEKDQYGYGVFCANSKHMRAHRVAYQLAGHTLVQGLVMDHLCRTRDCVNPSHLEQVTNETNVMRGESGPAQNARKTHCVNGHELAGHNVYLDTSQAKPKRKCRTCTYEASRRYQARKRAQK